MTISPPRGNRVSRLALAVVLLFIGVATLTPEWSSPKPDLAVTCLLCGDLGGPDLVLNVALFVPLGLALAALGVRPMHALGVSLALSLGIEGIQVLLPGRSTTLRDALCNAAGGWLGAILWIRVPRWMTPSPGTAVRLAGAVAAAVGAVALSGSLMGFAPSPPPYYGHWSPRQEHLAHWSGRLARVELDGLAIPDWRISGPEALRRAIADGFELRLAGTQGAPTSELGGIVTVSDARMREVLLVGPDGHDLVVRVRRRAANLRLAAPEARFPGLLSDVREGTALDIRIRAAPAGTCADVNGRVGCTGRPPAGAAWRLLLHESAFSAAARILLDAVALGALAFPVGLLLRGVAPRYAVAATMLLVTGTAAAARGTGLTLPTVTEWLGIAAGLVAGLVLNRLVTTVRRPPAVGLTS